MSEDEDLSDVSFCNDSYLTNSSSSFDIVDGDSDFLRSLSWEQVKDKEDMRRDIEKMKDLFILLEKRLGNQSSDISHLRSHVEDVVEFKKDLEEVKLKTGLVSDESDLAVVRNLEKKLHNVAQAVKTNIAQVCKV